MRSADGVIRYRLAHQTEALSAGLSPLVEALEPWRWQLWKVGLIGQDGVRYGGVGWGNLSARASGASFVITGTQTGGLEHTDARHYALVEASDGSTEGGLVESRGPVAPSSEAMSHAAVYAAGPWVRFVFHVHDPVLWRAAERLALPTTPQGVEYGTVAMARAVAERVEPGSGSGPRLLVMAGHEDGVLAWGADADGVGEALLSAYQASRQGGVRALRAP